MIERILEELQKRGYRIVKKGRIRGESGVEHTFDAIVEGRGKRFAITLLDRIGFEHVIPLLAFRNDLRIPHIVFAKEIEIGVENLLKSSNIIIIHLKDISVAYDHPKLREEEFLKNILKIFEELS